MALFIALETAGWPVEVAALQSNDVITGPGSVQDSPPHTYCTHTLQHLFMLDRNLCFFWMDLSQIMYVVPKSYGLVCARSLYTHTQIIKMSPVRQKYTG